MPTLRLTQGDLRKALPSGLSLCGRSLIGKVFYGMSPASGVVWGTEVRVLVTHSHCSEGDLGPGLGGGAILPGPHLCPCLYNEDKWVILIECAGVQRRGGPEVGPHGWAG